MKQVKKSQDKPIVISVEGVNGSGKSTLAKSLAKEFKIDYGRLPGQEDIPLSVSVRDILKDTPIQSPHAKCALYLADMTEFYAHLKKPVILDRSWISTIVYQTLEGVNESLIESFVKDSDIYVDYTVLLTCDINVALDRLNNREEKTLANYKDREYEFYQKVQDGYTDYMYAKFRHGRQFVEIDTTNKNEAQVLGEALYCINKDIVK
jgi:thymidylate kinase